MGAAYDVWTWMELAGKGIVPAWIIVASVGNRAGGTANPLATALTEVGTLIGPATARGGRGFAARAMVASDELG